MKYRVLIGGDLHKRMVDITTIKGYVKAFYKVQADIMNAIKKLGVTHFISLGDWFDGGYGSDTAAALSHTDIDREMYSILDGNFYGLIGNHIKIRMDSNPELFLIQPHPYYVSRHPVVRDYQIIRTPRDLVLNGVQFCFMHWDKDAENAAAYKANIDHSCKYHIGLYHTEYIIPAHIMAGMNMYAGMSDNTAIGNALDDIELAIVGHVHKPFGEFRIEKVSGGSTTMIIPGSLTNVDCGMNARHDYVDMPLIDIDDNGSVTRTSYRVHLHTDEVEFVPKHLTDGQKKSLKSLRGNTKETLYEELEGTTFVGEFSGFLTLGQFMRQQGYTKTDKTLIRTCIQSPDDINTLIQLYKEGNQCNLESP